MKPHTITHDLPRRERDDTIAFVTPAPAEAVELVMNAPVETGHGRSEWVFLRLANGDLALGVFPQGNTYEEVTERFDG